MFIIMSIYSMSFYEIKKSQEQNAFKEKNWFLLISEYVKFVKFSQELAKKFQGEVDWGHHCLSLLVS